MASSSRRFDHETRQHQIAAAARDIVTTEGLASLTVSELAERVGVTEAALYKHVRGKEEVLLLLVSGIRTSLFAAISEAMSPELTPIERLEHLLRLHLSYAKERRGVSFVIISESLRFGERAVKEAARKLVDDYLALVSAIVSDGIEHGIVRRDLDPEAAAVMFFGMVEASVTRWLFDESLHPLAEKSSAMWKLFHSAIVAAP